MARGEPGQGVLAELARRSGWRSRGPRRREGGAVAAGGQPDQADSGRRPPGRTRGTRRRRSRAGRCWRRSRGGPRSCPSRCPGNRRAASSAAVGRFLGQLVRGAGQRGGDLLQVDGEDLVGDRPSVVRSSMKKSSASSGRSEPCRCRVIDAGVDLPVVEGEAAGGEAVLDRAVVAAHASSGRRRAASGSSSRSWANSASALRTSSRLARPSARGSGARRRAVGVDRSSVCSSGRGLELLAGADAEQGVLLRLGDRADHLEADGLVERVHRGVA